MSDVVTLKEWSLVFKYGADPYTPPEALRIYLDGKVYGHPTQPDGKKVTTSHVTKVLEDGTVYTASGSCYKLDGPSKEYVDWCAENGHDINSILEGIKSV